MNVQQLAQNYLTKIKANKTPILVVAAIIIIGLLAWGFGGKNDEKEGLSSGSTSKSAQEILKVTSKDGEVVFSSNGQVWEFADVGTGLTAGSFLKANPGAKAIAQIPNGSVLRLNENASITASEKTSFSQTSGKIYYRVKSNDGKALSISSLDYTVKPSSSGAFELSVNAEAGRMNIKAIENSVIITSASGKIYTVEAGKEITLSKTSEPAYAGVSSDYLNSAWFTWNKEEDKKMGYEVTLEATVASAGTTAPLTNGTKTTLTTKTTTTVSKNGTSAPVPTSGSCRPGLSLKKGLGGMGTQLNWSACKSDDFQFYKVVRSTTNPNLNYPGQSAIISSSNKFFTAYYDKNIAMGYTYYYRVCVVERLGAVACGNVAKMAN